MKGYEWIGWLATVFLGFTIVNRILAGTWLAGEDIVMMNQLKVMQNVTFGFFSVPIPGSNYIKGVLDLLHTTNYSFFQGDAQVFYFFFQTVTMMIGFSIVVTIISIAGFAIRGR